MFGLIALLGIALCVRQTLEKYWPDCKFYSVFLAYSFVCTLLFIFGMVGLLEPGIWFLYGIGLLGFFKEISFFRGIKKIQKAHWISRYLTTDLFLFSFLSLICWKLSLSSGFGEWDEWAWGLFIKALHHSHEMYTAKDALLESQVRNPPMAPLFQFFLTRFQGFSESGSQLANAVPMMAAFSMCWHWLKPHLITFFLALGVFFLFAHSFASIFLLSLYADQVVGSALAGTLILVVALLRSKVSSFVLIPSLITFLLQRKLDWS